MVSRRLESARRRWRARPWTSLASAALSLAVITPASGQAQVPPSADSPADLRQELEREQEHIRSLEQRLAVLEAARREVPDATSVPPAAGDRLAASLGADGFALQSADGANVIRFRGNVSVDGRYFGDATTPATADTWLIRRLRPTLEGTLANHFDYRIMPDFGQGKTVVQDAWADVRVEPWLVLQFGKFKAPVGLERLQLEQYSRFIEPALTADLLPYRDLGFKVGGALARGAISYDVGIFDGAPDGGSSDGNAAPDLNSTGKFTWDGRVFLRPFLGTPWPGVQGLGAGVAVTYARAQGTASSSGTTSLLAGYRTTGQQAMFAYRTNSGTGGLNAATVADGIERRVVPQVYYYLGPVGLLGEYVQAGQQVERAVGTGVTRYGTLRQNAWQLQASWFLTGEREAYDRAAPKQDFGFGSGGTGAWELVARYHGIHFDNAAFTGATASFANPLTSVRAAHAVGVGVNWYLTRNFKAQLDYEMTGFAGGAAAGDRGDERVLTSQFALIF